MKIPLILVPGLLCDEGLWRQQIASLGDIADVQVANHDALDSLGALAEVILREAPPRFAIAGHSMGGRITLEVARRAPERLLGTALLDTGYAPVAAGDEGQKEAAARQAMLTLARREGMRVMARAWVQGMVYAPRLSERRLIESILDMFDRHTSGLYALQIRALLNRPAAAAVLATISCPTLVLCGREDAWAPPSLHELMAKTVQDGKLVVLEECGHMSPLERPKEVTAAFRKWLARVAAAAPATGSEVPPRG